MQAKKTFLQNSKQPRGIGEESQTETEDETRERKALSFEKGEHT